MNKLEKLSHSLHSLRERIQGFTLQHFADEYSKTYFLSVLVAAVIGYGFLLFFPIMGTFALAGLFEVSHKALLDLDTISQLLIWFAILILSVAMSHHIFTVQFQLPKGVELSADKTPPLFTIIENKKQRFFWPAFTNVLLSEQYELQIFKTPVTGIPFWSKNTLIIGLPLMQTLPQMYFNCMLERKLHQFAKGQNIVTNWLYQLRYVWHLYPQAFSHRKLLGEQVVAWFFKFYAPYYEKLSQHMAQREELAADSIALHYMNDSDLFKSIEAFTVGQHFYQNVYQPMLNKLIRDKKTPTTQIYPYTTLPKVFRKTVTPVRCHQWLEHFMTNSPNTPYSQPTLPQRMRNMGHTRIRPPHLEEASAAQYFFGAHYTAATRLMDTIWHNNINRLLARKRKRAKPTSQKPVPQHKPQQAAG